MDALNRLCGFHQYWLDTPRHVCYVNHIPFISIRTITDTAAHSGAGYFEENSKKASIIAKDITVALLKELYCKQ